MRRSRSLLPPFGRHYFGRIGDRIGRKPTLIIVLVMMTLATTAIGLVPVYASIGIAALILTDCVFFRACLPAVYGGAVSLMTEFAPRGKRGLYGAWQSFTVALGLLAGAGVVALISAILSPEELYAWGWRLPFFLAIPMGAWRSGYG
jgi:MFS family permease